MKIRRQIPVLFEIEFNCRNFIHCNIWLLLIFTTETLFAVQYELSLQQQFFV